MAFLFFAVLLLIVYGSLYPFDFSMAALESSGATDHFLAWDLFSSRGDVLGNVALFIPYGFAGMLALPSRRSFAANFVPLMLFGVIVAAGLQILQLFLPAREAALTDVLWNAVGLTLGAWGASLRPLDQALRSRRWRHTELVPFLLIACWFATELAPFVPSIDFQSIKDSLKPLLLTPVLDWQQLLRTFVAWLVVGFLARSVLAAAPVAIWLPVAMLGLLAAKIIIVENVVTVADVAGAAAAFLVLLLAPKLTLPRPLLALLLLYIAIAALEPFNLRAEAAPFGWLPFSGSLTGSMLINAKVIAGKVFLIGAALHLMSRSGVRQRNAVLLMIAFLAVLEFLQLWIGDHTPEITDPLLAALLGMAFRALGHHQPDAARSGARRVAAAASTNAAGAALARNRLEPGESLGARGVGVTWQGMVLLAGGLVVMSMVLHAVTEVPGLPYNVHELFGTGEAWWKQVLLALAVLWVGMGGALCGGMLAESRHPYLSLPIAAIAACLLTYGLLLLGTTTESIEDLAGSPNSYGAVVESQVWGAAAARLYETIGPDAIGAIETAVRFTALGCPLFLWLSVVTAIYLRMTAAPPLPPSEELRLFSATASTYVLCALPWLILFKLIAFDFSSTDNLNELIGPDGYLLYGLMVLGPIVVISIVHATRTLRMLDMMTATIFVLCSLPIGWFLLKNGLAAEVHKYGYVYSGVDFLLGPDRAELLPEFVLMLRWYAVQLAAVAILAYGMRIVMPVARRAAGHAIA